MAEIIKCPNCEKPLQIPESFVGQAVQCPECRHQFTAGSTAVSSPSAPPTSVAPPPETPLPKSAAYDDDRRADDARARRDRYDRDDYDIDRSSRIQRDLAPHRGGMILALGIIALVLLPCSTIICGPMAWIMGNSDLAEIHAGRMDPSGEGMVQAGRILGMISTGIFVLVILAYCLIGVAMVGIA